MRFTDILTSSAHALIVEGIQGEIRTGFVQDIVKGLNCECESPEGRPCNRCASCRQIDAGTSMDVFHMEKSGKTGYKVEDAAALIERIGMGSYGRHIIGVVDEADLLSETVQNKLLKTLEEPEDGAMIILAATNRDNLLRTVRSRCNVIRVSDYVDMPDEEKETDEAISYLAKRFSYDHFYEIRSSIDRKIKTQDDAIELLGIMEDEYRERMIGGDRPGDMAAAIDLVEKTRMDIYQGMAYAKALKKLYLEMEDLW